jgi:hypothetical protein
MTLQDLMKMTVTKLREEAHKFEVKDALGMSKDQLIELLCNKHGIEHKTEVAKGIGRRAMKAKIAELKKQRAQLLSEGSAQAVYVNRRRIRSVRRRLRKVIARAKRKAARAPKAATAAPEAPAS